MTDLSAVDLNLLTALELLLEERSVRGAARRANVSPSAMSHTLGRLRDLLGDEVLVRAGRRMVPTPRAEAVALPLEALLAQARRILAEGRTFDPARSRRRFRIVCTDHVSTVLLEPAEAILRAEAPRLDMIVAPLVPESMEDLRRGHIDAAIGIFPDAPAETRMRRLFTDRFVTVCRAGHPRLGRATELTLEDYLAESHVLVAPRGTPEGLVDRVLAERGLSRRVARAYPVFLAAMWHLLGSDGVLTVSARLVQAVHPRIPVRVFSPPLPLDPYAIALVWHPRVDKAPEDAWFRSVLVRAADALGAPIADR